MTGLDEPTLEMDAAEGSIVSNLRAAAKEQQKEKFVDLPVGGEFGKQLWIRYKPLDPAPMDRFFARRAKLYEDLPEGEGLPITELNMDLMAQACIGIYGADPQGENKEELLSENGQPLILDYRLIEFLQMPVPDYNLTSREVIMILFASNAMMIIDHGDDLSTWMRNPTAHSSVGES